MSILDYITESLYENTSMNESQKEAKTLAQSGKSDFDMEAFNALKSNIENQKLYKYMGWIARNWDDVLTTVDDLVELNSMLEFYDENENSKSYNLHPMRSYKKDFPEWYRNVQAAMNAKKRVTNVSDKKPVDRYNVIWTNDDNSIRAVVPQTKSASIKQGQGAQWCTAAHTDKGVEYDTAHMFCQYVLADKGLMIYIINDNLPEDDKFHKIAIRLEFDDGDTDIGEIRDMNNVIDYSYGPDLWNDDLYEYLNEWDIPLENILNVGKKESDELEPDRKEYELTKNVANSIAQANLKGYKQAIQQGHTPTASDLLYLDSRYYNTDEIFDFIMKHKTVKPGKDLMGNMFSKLTTSQIDKIIEKAKPSAWRGAVVDLDDNDTNNSDIIRYVASRHLDDIIDNGGSFGSNFIKTMVNGRDLDLDSPEAIKIINSFDRGSEEHPNELPLEAYRSSAPVVLDSIDTRDFDELEYRYLYDNASPEVINKLVKKVLIDDDSSFGYHDSDFYFTFHPSVSPEVREQVLAKNKGDSDMFRPNMSLHGISPKLIESAVDAIKEGGGSLSGDYTLNNIINRYKINDEYIPASVIEKILDVINGNVNSQDIWRAAIIRGDSDVYEVLKNSDAVDSDLPLIALYLSLIFTSTIRPVPETEEILNTIKELYDISDNMEGASASAVRLKNKEVDSHIRKTSGKESYDAEDLAAALDVKSDDIVDMVDQGAVPNEMVLLRAMDEYPEVVPKMVDNMKDADVTIDSAFNAVRLLDSVAEYYLNESPDEYNKLISLIQPSIIDDIGFRTILDKSLHKGNIEFLNVLLDKGLVSIDDLLKHISKYNILHLISMDDAKRKQLILTILKHKDDITIKDGGVLGGVLNRILNGIAASGDSKDIKTLSDAFDSDVNFLNIATYLDELISTKKYLSSAYNNTNPLSLWDSEFIESMKPDDLKRIVNMLWKAVGVSKNKELISKIIDDVSGIKQDRINDILFKSYDGDMDMIDKAIDKGQTTSSQLLDYIITHINDNINGQPEIDDIYDMFEYLITKKDAEIIDTDVVPNLNLDRNNKRFMDLLINNKLY